VGAAEVTTGAADVAAADVTTGAAVLAAAVTLGLADGAGALVTAGGELATTGAVVADGVVVGESLPPSSVLAQCVNVAENTKPRAIGAKERIRIQILTIFGLI
jgi:hypothetical protein